MDEYELPLSGPLTAGFFFALSRLEPPTNPAVESFYAILNTFFGLVILASEHAVLGRASLDPPGHGLGLLFSRAGRTFWTGSALCAIAAAQIMLPAYAHWLNILFWVVAGCAVLWPYLFRFIQRRLRQPAQPRV